MSTLRVPSIYEHPVGKIVEIVEGEPYSNQVEPSGTTEWMDDDAEVVTSEIVEARRRTRSTCSDRPSPDTPSWSTSTCRPR